ncbi:uncharacterized protein V6R79_016033 [Siganus canaliculatus]
MSVQRASQSGASNDDTTMPGPDAPGTTLPGTDRSTVEKLIRQLKREKIMRKRAERALKQQKIINSEMKRNKLANQKFTEMFTKDQIRALGQLKKRGIRWGKETIKKAIQIRFTAGTTGYKTLQQMQIPLPNIRTLQRRMQHVKLEPGVLGEVFQMLKLKTGVLTEMERECVLSLDEMAITPGVELHMGTGRLFGDVTLPDHKRQATHALVFMLAGATTRWKQVVAYHYSGNSTDGAAYQPIVVSIVEAAASVGLHVLNVTTDMGSPNRAMWKSFGVTYDQPWIQHPVETNKRLYFMPDVPHLVKNLKSAIVRGHIITIPQDVVEKEHLPSSAVSVAPLKDLVSFQEAMALKLAPNLSRGILEPGHFEKMKVSSAMHVFSKATSAALRYMVKEEHRPESYLTTAWFLERVDHWFDLMSSRHVVTALSQLKMEEYEKAISFLHDSIHLFRGLKIGPQGSWKPVQTGLVMATKTILEVQHDLLSKGHKFVLTSRFTQDCLENTFSCIRQRNPVPTPVEFHYGVRAVTVGQFLSTNHTGSYQDDAADHLADFLDTQTSICNASDIVRLEQLADPSPPNFTKTESCVLYHLAGYIVKRVISFSLCKECHCALVEAPANVTSQRAVLLEMKEFKKGALYRPSDEVFTLLKDVEQLFRSVTNDSLMESSNVVAQLEREAMSLHSNLPSCHELKKKIVTTYIRLRLRIQSKCIRAERKVNNRDKGHLGSKSQTKKVTTTRQTSSQKVTTVVNCQYKKTKKVLNQVTIIGVTEGKDAGTMQVLAADGQVFRVSVTLWEPFEQFLQSDIITANLEVEGNAIQSISTINLEE